MTYTFVFTLAVTASACLFESEVRAALIAVAASSLLAMTAELASSYWTRTSRETLGGNPSGAIALSPEPPAWSSGAYPRVSRDD